MVGMSILAPAGHCSARLLLSLVLMPVLQYHVASAGRALSECSGSAAAAQWLFCDDFEVDRTGSDYFEYIPTNGSFVRAPDVGLQGGYAMKATFEQGQVSAGALHLSFGKVPSPAFHASITHGGNETKYREIYWRLYLRNEPQWKGGGGAKLSRGLSFASAHWAEAAFAHVRFQRVNVSMVWSRHFVHHGFG